MTHNVSSLPISSDSNPSSLTSIIETTIEQVKNGKTSQTAGAREIGIPETTFRRWVKNGIPIIHSTESKLEAIQRVHNGEAKVAVARSLGIPESTLRGWVKNRKKMQKLVAPKLTQKPKTE